MYRTAAVVMADRGQTGFEGPVQLQPYHGSVLLGDVLAGVRTWPVDEIIVVLGADHEEILGAIDFEESTVIVNLEWEEGEASSLRAALDYLVRRGGVDAVVLVDACVPGVPETVVAALLDAFAIAEKPAVVPKYRYSRGEPVVVARELWPRLLGAEGDATAAHLLAAHPEWVEEVWFDRLAPRRITSPVDLASR